MDGVCIGTSKLAYPEHPNDDSFSRPRGMICFY